MDMATYAKHRMSLLTEATWPANGAYPRSDKVVKPTGFCYDCRTDLDEPQDYPPVARHDYDGYPLGWRCYWCDQLKNQAPISSRKSANDTKVLAVQLVCVLLMLGLTVFGIIMNLSG